MTMRQKKNWMASLFAAVCALALAALPPGTRPAPLTTAEEAAVTCLVSEDRPYLIPVGRTAGIKLFSHGVLVVGFAEGDGGSPAQACGLKVGDLITQINGACVNTIGELSDALQGAEAAPLTLSAQRGGHQLQLEVDTLAQTSDGSRQLGVWVRDSMAGIGTVTFYDPETGVFAALGHGITDVDTGVLMPLRSGAILSARVTGILKGTPGSPGQLHGTFDLEQDSGSLYANTSCGIFGHAEEGTFSGTLYPMAYRSEVTTGKATILTNINGSAVQEYTVEILRVYPEALSATQNLMLQVTDPALLEATGGIVQGMSGSPILQNGRLVGAVTHVLVNDPTRGYGILAENMVSAAAN
jgi:stage IV sporulation protein B